jgi:hypothetical protein
VGAQSEFAPSVFSVKVVRHRKWGIFLWKVWKRWGRGGILWPGGRRAEAAAPPRSKVKSQKSESKFKNSNSEFKIQNSKFKIQNSKSPPCLAKTARQGWGTLAPTSLAPTSLAATPNIPSRRSATCLVIIVMLRVTTAIVLV